MFYEKFFTAHFECGSGSLVTGAPKKSIYPQQFVKDLFPSFPQKILVIPPNFRMTFTRHIRGNCSEILNITNIYEFNLVAIVYFGH